MTSSATDLRFSPSAAPVKTSKTRTSPTSLRSAPSAARTSFSASTSLSTTKAKSRRTGWKADRASTGLVRVALRLGVGIASRNTSKPQCGPEASSVFSVFGWNSPNSASTTLGPSLIRPERPGWYQSLAGASIISRSTGAPAASSAAMASALASYTETAEALPFHDRPPPDMMAVPRRRPPATRSWPSGSSER